MNTYIYTDHSGAEQVGDLILVFAKDERDAVLQLQSELARKGFPQTVPLNNLSRSVDQPRETVFLHKNPKIVQAKAPRRPPLWKSWQWWVILNSIMLASVGVVFALTNDLQLALIISITVWCVALFDGLLASVDPKERD